jgi:hypothetical protein
MKVEIPDELYSEFKCLTNLLEKIDSSQDFKNPQELISYLWDSMSNGAETH